MIRVLFILLMLTAVIGLNSAYAASFHQQAPTVEVFTTTDRSVQWEPETEISAAQNIDLQVYELNRIQLFETALSNDLPANPNQAKQIVLQRIQQLNEQAMPAIQNAAVGLAKAIQYGVDRYPAIVFDGEAAVYGLTDLGVALDHYRAWRGRTRP